MSFQRLLKLLSFTTFCFLMNGCTSNPTPIAANHSQQVAKSFRPDLNKSVLYIYRPYAFVKSARLSSFKINDQHLGEFRSGYFRVSLRPGNHKLRVFFPADYEENYYKGESQYEAMHRELTISAASGDVIFVRFEINGSFTSVSAGRGKQEVSELELYQGRFSHMDQVFLSAEEIAWQACFKNRDINTCQSFLTTYPSTGYRNQAQLIIDKQEGIERREKLQTNYERDGQLPKDVRRDKYMVALTAHLKNESYEDALLYFEWLERLGSKLDPSFNYFYGEALLKTGYPEQAISKLYVYIQEVGASGKYYIKALELVNEAESQ